MSNSSYHKSIKYLSTYVAQADALAMSMNPAYRLNECEPAEHYCWHPLTSQLPARQLSGGQGKFQKV